MRATRIEYLKKAFAQRRRVEGGHGRAVEASVNTRLPRLACDAHLHVFGPPSRYPGAPTRQYQPLARSFDDYRAVAGPLGLARAVLVQPSAYGSDNRCLLDTLRAHPESTRGVVVIDPALPEDALAEMHALGVRGVRLNLMNPRVQDAAGARRLVEPVVRRIERYGWHLQIYADPDVVAPLADLLASLPVPVVLDHCAGARAGRDDCDGARDLPAGAFAALVRLYAAERCWVKLSGADIVAGCGAVATPTGAAELAPAAPYLRALVAAGTQQLVWGTDWPHLFHFHGPMGDAAPDALFRAVDDDALVALLHACVPDAAARRRILVDNPARLYGFDGVTDVAP